MKSTIKVMSIIAIILGGLAIIGSAEGDTDAWTSFVGGGFFLAIGICNLIFLNQLKKPVEPNL